MTKAKCLLCVFVLSLSCLFTGCGEKMLTITEEESDIIATYSAKLISKFNLHQKTGYCNAYTTTTDLGITPTPRPDTLPSPEEENITTEDVVLVDDPNAGESSSEGGFSESVSVTDPVKTEPPEEDISSEIESVSGYTLSEAIGIAGLDFDVTGLTVTNQFVAGDYFALTAAGGCDYAVIEITGKNSSNVPVDLDIKSMGNKFKLYINNKYSAVNQTTILLNDFSSYKGTINAGEKKNFVLIFQFKSSQLENLEKVDLRVAGESGDMAVNVN